jgi:hypothetical protein
MEAKCSSKTVADFQWTTWYYIPEDSTLHNHCCENLKCYICMSLLTYSLLEIFGTVCCNSNRTCAELQMILSATLGSWTVVVPYGRKLMWCTVHFTVGSDKLSKASWCQTNHSRLWMAQMQTHSMFSDLLVVLGAPGNLMTSLNLN